MRHGTIFGSSVMAGQIRSRDWSDTSLGMLDMWSDPLLTLVNTLLSVPSPAQLFWGAERITFYNDAFLPFLSNKHPDALGQPARVVWQEVWKDVGAQIEAVFAEGRSYSYENLPLQLLQDGVLREWHCNFTYSPVFAQDGSVAALFNLAQDNTEAFLAQQALKASEQRFRSLVDKASVGIAIGNVHGELTYLNPNLLHTLEYAAEDVAAGAVRWDKLTPPEYSSRDRQALSQLEQDGVAEPYEKVYRTKSGGAVPLLIGAAVIPPDPLFGSESDIAVFATDLRKQKRAESALLQTEKLAAVGKLASSISHEINNPLEAVTNLLYIVRQDTNLSQTSRDFLETADRELARVSQVTSQTLRFHRQSTGPKTVAPEVLVDEVLQLYNNRLSNFGIMVSRSYGPDVKVPCYEGDIRQVLNNLIGNAMDAMRSGGNLAVRTRFAHRPSSGEEGVLITIADTGVGMAREVQKHIFDAFYTTKGVHGTGLGLWISCRIVHKHRGYVRAYSATGTRDHGTVFHLWLPSKLAETARESWHEQEILANKPF